MADLEERLAQAAEHPDKRGAEDGDPPQAGPDDPPETGEGADEEEEAAETPEEQGEPEPPKPPQGLSEKEIDARIDKLDKEGRRHRNRLAEILDEDVLQLLPCELCEPGLDGFHYAQIPEERRSAVMTAIGFSPEPELEEAKDARQCPDCKGHGKVKTGSKVQGFDAMVCMACNGAGAVGPRFEQKTMAEFTAAITPPGNGPQPAVEDTSDEGIMAAALRTKGFTVIEPYAPAGA